MTVNHAYDLNIYINFFPRYGIPSQRKEILHDLLPGDLPTQPFPDVMSSTKILRRVSMRIGDWKILKMLSG